MWFSTVGIVATGLVLALFLTGSTAKSQRSLRHLRNLRGIPARNWEGVKLPADHWFEQKLDHFDPTNERTWLQRYQLNDSFFPASRDAPVFIMIGGEGEASAEWLVEGMWIEYAQKYSALCFQLEHRFYGKSYPTEDMSTKNLKYLSSEQALADLAYFIEAMNAKYQLTSSNKWIAFGGSYPGSLAAWVRNKYPHFIHGAVSTSGPLLAIADFKAYDEVVEASLATSSDDCVTQLKKGVKHFNKLLQRAEGAKTIQKKFKTCTDIDVTNKKDVANLKSSVAGNIQGVVQYNKDNRLSQTASGKVNIDEICSILTNRSIGDPLTRYATINTLFLDLDNETCLDFSYEEMIKGLKEVSWNSTDSDGGRQWTYQTCTEFGFFQTSTQGKELFGAAFDLEFYLEQCRDIFGEHFNEKLLNGGIVRSNTIYGQLDLEVSRVLFVHGSIDPWHALGITETRSKQAPAIYINGTAHCANMYPPAESDPPQLIKARVRIENTIGKWLMSTD